MGSLRLESPSNLTFLFCPEIEPGLFSKHSTTESAPSTYQLLRGFILLSL